MFHHPFVSGLIPAHGYPLLNRVFDGANNGDLIHLREIADIFTFAQALEAIFGAYDCLGVYLGLYPEEGGCAHFFVALMPEDGAFLLKFTLQRIGAKSWSFNQMIPPSKM
jgi:hypothetical protein